MEREISIILKIKGAKEAKKAVEDVFSGQNKTLVEGFNKGLKKTGANLDGVSKKSKKAKTGMDSFTKTLGRGMAALYLYNRAWNIFGTSFESGLQLERAGAQFERHVGNVSKMLPELQAATRGVVSDFDLLKTSNRAFQQGIKPEQMGKTFSLATSAAQKLGLQASDAINTITNAITKQDEGALNTLGVVTSVNQAYKTQAALISKNGGVMSQAMAIQLRQTLIMRELERRFGGVNAAQEDGLMILDRFRSSWKNFRAALGDTIGLALRPLTQVLTNVLDLTTGLLKKLNETSGFRNFVQIAATLAGVLGGLKFINGAKTLLSLFGFFGTAKGSGLPKMLTKTNVLMGAFGRVLISKVPLIGKLTGSLTRLLGLSASFARVIPGWGTAIALVMTAFGPLTTLIKKVWTAGKVFLQLLNNFDENSGLSKVLKADADALGGLYYTIETVAKGALYIGAVLKGMSEGISQAFAPIGAVWDAIGDGINYVANQFGLMSRTGTVATSHLDAVTNKVKGLVKWLGLGVSAIAMFVPGLQMAGLAGVSVFGGSLLNDMGAADALQSGYNFVTGANQSQQSPIQTQPQMSTQIETPSPRAMNLDYSEDQSELLKKMNKILEKQTGLMEEDSAKQDIRESQNRANNNILLRR